MKRPLNEAEAFRAQELLIERATYGLDAAQRAELAALGADEDVSFDLAAAAIDMATVRYEELPAGVADKVLIAAGVAGAARASVPMPQQAQTPQTLAGVAPARIIDTRQPWASQPGAIAASSAGSLPSAGASGGGPVVGVVVPISAPAPAPVATTAATAPARPAAAPAPVIPIRRSRAPLVAAWIAAAACLALAAGSFLWARGRGGTSTTTTTAARSPSEERAALLASAPDVATLAWTATGDPAAAGASGDVVWSAAAQRGFMRFVGLRPNDPSLTQYQLWIFDKARDERFPVDGGVFDVSSTGEVVVPISPKLAVGGATLFAVTVEAPGGVVVSKRERIVVTAAPAAPTRPG